MTNNSRVLEFRQPISKRRAFILGFSVWALFFIAWELAVATGVVSELLLPTPLTVAETLVELLFKKGFVFDILDSVLRVVLSFMAACLVAVPLGILMGSFPAIEAAFNPFVSAWRYLPAPAFIPVLLMWMGTGEGPKLALLFIGVIFFLITLVMDHTRNVRRELLETSMTLGGNRRQILLTVVVPAALPDIVVAMRQMLAVSWTYLVIAEIVASTTGIGAVMMKARRFLHTDEIMASIVTIGVLGLLFDVAFRLAHRLLFSYASER